MASKLADRSNHGAYLSADELRALTPAGVETGLREIAGLIRSRARQGEIDRRIDDDVIRAIGRTGYFYQLMPEEFGGTGATIDDYINSTLIISEADLSTAWVASFYTLHNWYLAHFPKEAHDETWNAGFSYILTPATGAPLGSARPVDGGYIVNGHWKWGTGINHADWFMGILLVEGRESEGLAICLTPTDDVTVVDTWQAAGMAATGSNDIIAKDLFVPEHRFISLAEVMSGNERTAKRFDNRIFAMPMIPFFTLSAAILPLGAARAAIALATERLKKHVRPGATIIQGDKPIAQSRLARANLLAKTAELKLRYVGRELTSYMDLPEVDRLPVSLALRAHAAEAVEMCRESISQVCATAGSSMHLLDNPLQRMARDVTVLSSHVVLDMDVALEQYGRDLLGLEPSSAYV